MSKQRQKYNIFQRAARRVLAPLIKQERRLAAARYSRLVADWKTQLITLDSELRQDIRKLIERTRALYREDSFVQRAAWVFASGIVGPDGPGIQNKARLPDETYDRKTNKMVEEALADFMREPEVTGRHSMAKLLFLTFTHLFVDGNAFWEIKRGSQYKHGFSIKLWDLTWLALEKNQRLANGNEIRCGVEIDPDGRPVAFYKYVRNPYDVAVVANASYSAEIERIEAKDIVWWANITEAGQTLGIPMLTQGVLKLRMHGMYEESAIVLARMAAQCGAVIETNVPDHETRYVEAEAPHIEFEAGMLAELPPGKSFKTVQFGSGVERYEPVIKGLIRNIAAGFNLSYPTVSNDHSGLNLAVIKHVVADEREGFKVWQGYMVHKLRHVLTGPVMWADMSATRKVLRVSPTEIDEKVKLAFYPRRWSALDPQGEANAYVTLINNALMTRETAVRLLGFESDWESVCDGLDSENKLLAQTSVKIFTVSGQESKPGQTSNPGTSGNEAPQDPQS